MNILLIPEDFRKDQYILKPIFKRLLRDIGKPRALIRVCQDPLLGGVTEALKPERLSEIFERYDAMIDIFILCVDRDGHAQRRQRLDRLQERFGNSRVFLAETAWEELETWVLAGVELPTNWRWADVRAEVQVKEQYFDVIVGQRELGDHPGGGRKPLAEQAAQRIGAIRQKCPEDFDALAQRIEAAVQPA